MGVPSKHDFHITFIGLPPGTSIDPATGVGGTVFRLAPFSDDDWDRQIQGVDTVWFFAPDLVADRLNPGQNFFVNVGVNGSFDPSTLIEVLRRGFARSRNTRALTETGRGRSSSAHVQGKSFAASSSGSLPHRQSVRCLVRRTPCWSESNGGRWIHLDCAPSNSLHAKALRVRAAVKFTRDVSGRRI